MKTLHLILKRKWFEMIASGEKTEEYRDITSHWSSRLLLKGDWLYYKKWFGKGKDEEDKFMWLIKLHIAKGLIRFDVYTHITFQLGYQKNAPRMTFEIENISIGKGREEWGAERDKKYYIIKLGKRI